MIHTSRLCPVCAMFPHDYMQVVDPMSGVAAEAILKAAGQKVLPVKGDGNCLFRALGYYLYGTEMMHCKTRAILAKFVAKNSNRFECIIMDGTIEGHIEKMQELTVWGTQVELQATASLYQIPVYLLTFSSQVNKYSWQCYQPWDPSTLNFTDTEPLPTHISELDHIELLHLRSCHFDCILHKEGGFSLDRPVLDAVDTKLNV